MKSLRAIQSAQSMSRIAMGERRRKQRAGIEKPVFGQVFMAWHLLPTGAKHYHRKGPFLCRKATAVEVVDPPWHFSLGVWRFDIGNDKMGQLTNSLLTLRR